MSTLPTAAPHPFTTQLSPAECEDVTPCLRIQIAEDQTSTPLLSINTGLPLLHPLQTFEHWKPLTPAATGAVGQIKWAQFSNLLLTVFTTEISAITNICVTTESAYKAMLETARDQAFPHVVRTWNYLPQINSGGGDREAYKQFCVGRAQAYDHLDIAERDYAAASALGSPASFAVFYQLSSSQRGTHFENPEQKSAFHYPRQYGPRSPSFARATLCDVSGKKIVFISGTASVEGHRSVYPGDAARQTHKTLQNIQTLLESIELQGLPPLSPDFLKVYIRHSDDLERIKNQVSSTFQCPAVYVQADICRKDLLVEIDGHCWLSQK